jgi:hypothetical protein
VPEAPQGAIFICTIERKYMLADKLKARAQEVKNSTDKKIQEAIVAQVINTAENYAAEGKFTVDFPLTLNGWSIENAFVASDVLRGQGFKCAITNRLAGSSCLEIAAKDRYLIVSWY